MKKIVLLGICMAATIAAEVTAATATVKWTAPTQRENGKQLAITELAGFELQYKAANENQHKVLVLPNVATSATVQALATGVKYEFRIAAKDTDGLYSGFVQLTEVMNNPPKPVSSGTFTITQ